MLVETKEKQDDFMARIDAYIAKKKAAKEAKAADGQIINKRRK